MELTFPHASHSGFDGLYGLVIDAATEERVTAHTSITERLKQPAGIVHGGVYAAIAESVASHGTLLVVGRDGQRAMGLSNHTSFLRPMSEGTIHAVALRRHRGRTTWVWEVELRDDAAKLCALSRVTIAVR